MMTTELTSSMSSSAAYVSAWVSGVGLGGRGVRKYPNVKVQQIEIAHQSIALTRVPYRNHHHCHEISIQSFHDQ